MDQVRLDSQIWQKLLLSSDRLEKVGLHLLTPEAKIVGAAALSGQLSVKQAMIASGLSYRGFYLVLKRLRATGIVQVNKGRTDRRQRIISLVSTRVEELREPLIKEWEIS